MNVRIMNWAICAALVLASAASAEEKVKLEYKLKPGTELTYEASGTIGITSPQSAIGTKMAFAGAERLFIADMDAKSGLMLIGQTPDIIMKMKYVSPNGVQAREQGLQEATAFQMDRAGNPVVRKPTDNVAPTPAVERMMHPLTDRRQFNPPALPPGEVAVGAAWQSDMDYILPTANVRAQVKVASTLAEIKVVDGHKCALIKSKLSTKEDNAGNAANLRSQATVAGDMETLFDIEGGFVRSTSAKFDAVRLLGGRPIQNFTVDTTMTFDSAETLPADEAAAAAKAIQAISAAIAALQAGEYDKAAEPLDKLMDADLPDAWKAQVQTAVFQVNEVKRVSKQPAPAASVSVPAPASPTADELNSAAQKAMNDENWTDAVAKFKELAGKYPNDARTADALTAAAAICENRLNDPKSADELRKKAAALKAGKP